MKKIVLISTFAFVIFSVSWAQEYANFNLTGEHQGIGFFTNTALSDFTWQASGTLAQEVQILDDEVFDDGNEFENIFGQADNAENLRLQIIPNGSGTAGQAILSKARLTISFDQITPNEGWGFCVVDIDVENCLFSAIDEYDNEVSAEDINDWLIELFDTDTYEDGINLPKWDASHAALLGSDTPEDYVIYNNIVIGGLDDSEAAAAFFMPNMRLKSLIIDYESLQENYSTSYHFYIASLQSSVIIEKSKPSIAIYPNPASTYINIKLPYISASQFSQKQFIIYNPCGKIVSQINFVEDNQIIDIAHLRDGVYYTKTIIGENHFVQKLIIL